MFGDISGEVRHARLQPRFWLALIGCLVTLVAGVPAVAVADTGPTTTVTGRVLTPDGSDAGGSFRISVYRAGGDRTSQAVVDSAADGSFSVALDQGDYELVAMPLQDNSDGFAPGDADVTVPASGTVTARIELQRPNLSGLVSDPDGTAITGALVTVATTDTSPTSTAVTDPTGHYHLKLAPGAYQLWAAPPPDRAHDLVGQLTTASVPDSGSGSQDVTLPAVNLIGQVVDPNGAAVADAPIEGLQGSSTNWSGGLGSTEPDGTFYLHLDPGNWQLRADPTQDLVPDDSTSAAVPVDVPPSGQADSVTRCTCRRRTWSAPCMTRTAPHRRTAPMSASSTGRKTSWLSRSSTARVSTASTSQPGPTASWPIRAAPTATAWPASTTSSWGTAASPRRT